MCEFIKFDEFIAENQNIIREDVVIISTNYDNSQT